MGFDNYISVRNLINSERMIHSLLSQMLSTINYSIKMADEMSKQAFNIYKGGTNISQDCRI